ncbi:substrate-binding periplasmic protein [Pseudomonas xionganensis]|uniref:Transporter substrate-binding domain-containing protein n=1 Tax=Pseudomonas xionganensis TaxID=2654845 RepID=A0A6I4KPC2_9PSED|nr:transporter substrate-binding domain-containing protein [Pseudomonas xionganensis]MVW74380.1 transporter substrate-binding domain-containing protein [Pseudomonas xionganensis]
MPGIKSLFGLVLLLCGLPLQAEVRLYAWERPPRVQLSESGEARGLVPELVAELFRRAGASYQLSFLPLQRAMRQVQREPGSCVLLVERRQERDPYYSWIGPLLISRLGLYARAGDDLQLASLEQARGLSILSHQGSGAGEYLSSVGLQVINSNKEALNLSMLQRGRARLWATSATVVSSFNGREPPREVLPFLTLMEEIACHPQFDPQLQQRLQAALHQLYAEDWVAALYARHGLTQE